MRFHVIGLGPLGSLVAHNLRRAIPPTHSVAFLHRSPKELNVPHSIHVETDGTVTTASGFAHELFQVDRTTENPSIESLFVTTKAPSTVAAISQLVPRLSENSTIVLVQNGLAVYDLLIQRLFRNPYTRPHFIFATTSHGLSFPPVQPRIDTLSLLQPFVGTTEFATIPDPSGRSFEAGFLDESVPYPERRPRLSDLARPEGDPAFQRYRSLRNTVAALLLAEPLNARWMSLAHVQLALRRKLVVHSVIHPLTAILGCRNGDLFANGDAVRLAGRICREASEVYGAQIREETKAWMAASNSEMGGALGIAKLPAALQGENLLAECLRVSQNSKGSVSEMLSALRRGSRTEIDFLNGYLIKLGRMYGVSVPANATVYDMVKMRTAVPLDQIL
ncbi:ketopantoate reductase-like protein [Mycena crocata]|nr:ketopantoate reductase-like protein [Mycena crocata]